MQEHRTKDPYFSVIVPCRNENSYISECLKSILNQQVPRGDFEVLVVDGMSNDGTRQILGDLARTHSRLRVLDNVERLTPTALNIGIRAALGQVIVRMDCHADYDSTYLIECQRALEETGADNVGGPRLNRGRSFWQKAIALSFHSPFAMGGARSHQPDFEGDVDTIYFGCWRREVFDRIGYFDERLIRNQDDEFNLRLIQSGGRVYQTPRIRFWYYPRRNLWEVIQQYAQYGYWKVAVIGKHRRPAAIRHLIPSFVLILAFILLILSFWKFEFLILLSILVCLYFSLSCLSSFLLCLRYGQWNLLGALPIVFACFQFSYGGGFLLGLFRAMTSGTALDRSRWAARLTR